MTQAQTPVGMVDRLDPTPRRHSPFEQALLKFLLGSGPAGPELIALVTDPEARAAYTAAEVGQRSRDWPFLGLYRGENETVRKEGCPKVVFIGDSITEIWRYADPGFFTNGIIGRGISGQTTPQTLIRFYPDVVALRPQAVHILCGSNDIAGNTGATTPQDYKNNILAMLDIAQVNGINVLLGSITPAAGFTHSPQVRPIARIAELNDWLRHTANERGAVFIDYFSALAAEDRSLPPRYTNDGLHPNRAGYDVMRPLVVEAMRV
ncbi:lysophospholipase L1-like esterase [Rhodanobacter sp. ANJX3]|uniref:GDSL-type esterase/lipase family protein n=1 Tax=unclassified Rhodanobacter TaxID=2621553 RepID=UPI0015CAC4E2|nr:MULTISPECIES: GDSL-type esterase/lipase family protein [unclassified Rhodanobacter]MBB5357470.1 lysophospholipase L1-like esterase [Rhodanobacter sp. ANJX3]NYE27519.1 lysophospholipase L1-like esterase [Rhodanobacter sp. K2T2]